jgi:hypothetical protein
MEDRQNQPPELEKRPPNDRPAACLERSIESH